MTRQGTRGWRLLAALPLLLVVPQVPVLANAYPTETTADYVIGCMAANGQTQDGLRRCSCSIDAIASVVPFEMYERADTVLRMRQVGGEAAGMFRDVAQLRDVVDQLREAQVEADFRCF